MELATNAFMLSRLGIGNKPKVDFFFMKILTILLLSIFGLCYIWFLGNGFTEHEKVGYILYFFQNFNGFEVCIVNFGHYVVTLYGNFVSFISSKISFWVSMIIGSGLEEFE